jgi:hypothetical protein
VIGPSQRPLPANTQHSQETFTPQAGFKPAIPASKRPQTHAFDRAATGFCAKCIQRIKISTTKKQNKIMKNLTQEGLDRQPQALLVYTVRHNLQPITMLLPGM